MNERFYDNVVWPLGGIGLAVLGGFLIANASGQENVDWWKYLIYCGLIGVGLLMVRFEKAIALFDAALDRYKKFRTPPPESSEPTANQGSTAASQPDVDSFSIKQGVVDEDAPPPAPDEWNRLLRPVLSQASHYTVPTYYLNTKLQIIDWNVAFELVFWEILGKIRNKHVNFFINELQNRNDVFDHAREFTRKLHEGFLALVDIEPLAWHSAEYGEVKFVKVAALLSDVRGEPQGWSVSLMPLEIDWGPFQRDLYDKIREDKLWSVYSASYDRILRRFPPYSKLIEDVIAVVPEEARAVIDLGAGTGNVTAALLKGELRVTAVENNLAMLEKLRGRNFNPLKVTIVKGSVEFLDSLCPQLNETFDAAVMVNVLYAVRSPLNCLQSIFRLLKPGGVLAFSTTHSETRLDPLLDSIKRHLKDINKLDALAQDYQRLSDANKDIEQTIARRHSREKYREWVKTAGFQITKDVPATYEGAVMLIHAVKPDPGKASV